MSNLYTQQGVDFDTWFQPGTGNQWLGIYGDNGTDIGQKYAAGSGGDAVAWYAPDGSDLNRHFAGYGYGLYRVGGYPWNYRCSGWGDTGEVNYWKDWLSQWQSKKYSVKNVGNIWDDCWYRSVDSDFEYSCCIFAWSPYSGSAVNFNYWRPNARLRKWYNVSLLYIEISPWLKGVVICPHCGAGASCAAEVRVNMSQAGQPTIEYDGVYGIDNDDNHPQVANWGESRSEFGRWWTFHI